jgi:Ca-activated chloride channel family protein
VIRLASPWFLLLAPSAAALVVATLRWRRRVTPRLELPEARHLAALGSTAWTRLERGLPWVRVAALTLVALALARPQSGSTTQSVSSRGVDVVVALDASGSMRCEDVRPRSRLQVARESVSRFVAKRPSDRIGLVVFGTFAATRCPLTLDHQMLQSFLESVDFAPPGEDETALGMGLATAVQRLSGSAAKSKVVVLVTDGRSNRGQIDPRTAAAAAKALGVRVYAVGVGAEGEAACPQDTSFGTRYVLRREDLDEPLLRAIAAGTGGRYFRAADPAGMEAALTEIDSLEKTEIESQVRVLWGERFQGVLASAGALVLLEIALAATRLRRIP